MIICQKCGENNALGHMFCKKCGAKLDLNRLTSDVVAQAVRANWFRRYSMELVGLPVVVIVLAVIFALWPRTATVGEKGTLMGAKRIENSLRAFDALRPGESSGAQATFSEKDINGYFEHMAGFKLGLSSASVAIDDEGIRARLIRTPFSVAVWKFRFSPKFSMDWLCVPMGGRLHVKHAGIGHLRMMGPGRGIMAAKLASLFGSHKAWGSLAHTKEIRLQPGAVAIVLAK